MTQKRATPPSTFMAMPHVPEHSFWETLGQELQAPELRVGPQGTGREEGLGWAGEEGEWAPEAGSLVLCLPWETAKQGRCRQVCGALVCQDAGGGHPAAETVWAVHPWSPHRAPPLQPSPLPPRSLLCAGHSHHADLVLAAGVPLAVRDAALLGLHAGRLRASGVGRRHGCSGL